ncbi:MAG: hypothetical protein R2794_02740 [Chitinophagales bacterium]
MNAISKMMSPGFLTAALGLDWKPSSAFSLFVSPATGKFTFVLDDNIDNALIDTAEQQKQIRRGCW